MKNIKKIQIIETAIVVVLLLIGISLRLLPHPPNFVPVTAIALFAGVYLSKRIAFILPIAVMLISDVFIGYYQISLMVAVYGSFLLSVTLGFWLKKRKKWHNILTGSLLASFLFFILTNFAVWAFTPWYAKTFSGLIQCYYMALPFFRNTLLGGLFYVSALFGIYELAGVLVRKNFLIVSPEKESLKIIINNKDLTSV